MLTAIINAFNPWKEWREKEEQFSKFKEKNLGTTKNSSEIYKNINKITKFQNKENERINDVKQSFLLLFLASMIIAKSVVFLTLSISPIFSIFFLILAMPFFAYHCYNLHNLTQTKSTDYAEIIADIDNLYAHIDNKHELFTTPNNKDQKHLTQTQVENRTLPILTGYGQSTDTAPLIAAEEDSAVNHIHKRLRTSLDRI